MSEVVIRVENLGKIYRIGAPERYKALRDTLTEAVTKPFRRLHDLWSGTGASPPDSTENTIWALKNVSFEVKRGEVIGIIGRNGAGKSTLLKILSRITEPTEGFAEIRGRVGSLLEVGTGFHPELTGRENIYLNGAILGMKKAEIERKFDEMVAFAEVEKFIDTPVKHYSSGMYLRLAFAVAAHLEPEILMVDEVLAVGDAAFQKKCLGKMEDVAKEGRTVLFVSHNMAAITSLCSISLLLDRGYVKQTGPPSLVIASYMSSGCADSNAICLLDHPNRTPGYQQLLTRIVLDLEDGNIAYYGQPLKLELDYNFPYPIATPQFVISFHTAAGVRAFSLISDYQRNNVPSSLEGEGRIECQIKNLPLLPGTYFISLRLWQPGQKLDEIDNIIAFQVEWLGRDIGQFNWDSGMGVVYVDADWRVKSGAEHQIEFNSIIQE